jgi:glycerophosphoryl diester phosphodiesterase
MNWLHRQAPDSVGAMKMRTWPYLDAGKPVAIAHRGSAAHAEENSMAAFAHAVDLGYRYLETDVHATRDGTLLAFHDATLDRVSNASGAIAALDWSDVGAARLHNGESIPLLEDLLGAWPDVFINVDVKAESAIAPLIETVRRTNAVDRLCVASFSDRRLRAVREALGPNLCTSAGPGEVLRLRLASFGLPAPRPKAACVQVPEYHRGIRVVDRRFVERAHHLGLPVHVWTVNDETDMNRLLDIGVDGIVSDETELLKQVFQARDIW